MKKYKKEIIIAVVVLVGIILLFFAHKVLRTRVRSPKIALISKEEKLSGNKVYTNYNDFSQDFDFRNIKERDFNNNNYVVVKVEYDSCADHNIVPTDYKIEGNKLIFTFYYDQKCGVCAAKYLYYAIKIDKSIEHLDIELDPHARSQEICDPYIDYKPVIYIYPEEDTVVNVKLGSPNNITVSYPIYNDGWKVLAKPNGSLYDLDTNKEYYALYWEGKNFINEVTDEGFVVSKEDTVKFLEEKLSILGLSERESNEFIIYWLDKLNNSDYNYIRFLNKEEIDNYMPLLVEPKPDNIIRINMVYKPLNERIKVKEQKLESPTRQGYTVVEWGGSKIS